MSNIFFSSFLKPSNFSNNNLFEITLQNNSLFDFFNKKQAHFDTKFPYQFLYRINYSFDCFLLAVHYSLFLTYHLFYFHFGSSVKTRFKLPIFKFNNWFSDRLHTNKLKFWLDLKFLIFNSYTLNSFTNINKYIGYFPLNFYYSVFDFNFASILRFSPIAFDLNNYKSKYFRKRNNYNYDVDLHISLF